MKKSWLYEISIRNSIEKKTNSGREPKTSKFIFLF